MGEFIGTILGWIFGVGILLFFLFFMYLWYERDRYKAMKLFEHPNDIPKRFEVDYVNLEGENKTFWIEPFALSQNGFKMLIRVKRTCL